MIKQDTFFPVSFTCHASRWKDGEQFVAQHSLGLVVAGDMELDFGAYKKTISAGDVFFCRRNQLLKFKKLNGSESDFKTITLFFDENTLTNFAKEFKYNAKGDVTHFKMPKNDSLIKIFMKSLLDYEDFLETDISLAQLKQREALLLLLKNDVMWQNVLFDFSQPVKIALKDFMEENFQFNVSLERFAYLTGRSLTSFKRDFKIVFNESPARWILKKRLGAARELLTKERKTSIEIYQDLGFQDLSHFSYAFKKHYGIAPSMVTKQT
ncbi:helix-turn-helix domain-containing protein [Flavobacterium psychrotrophum]|uniref:helix-turn-helix domain-containing protein n=1 Tax=Flavobacterium psychrotrophum TaxID=2294119 RepID=UPI000E3225EA|nr:AraC family transcriptional regulator [Flavobacterium psychrotrophum]